MLLLFERQTTEILQNVYNEQGCSDPTRENERITLAAAKLLKTEIKEMKICSESYPNSDEMGSLEFCKVCPKVLASAFRKYIHFNKQGF